MSENAERNDSPSAHAKDERKGEELRTMREWAAHFGLSLDPFVEYGPAKVSQTDFWQNLNGLTQHA